MSQPSDPATAGLTNRALKAGTSMAVMTGIENVTILARTLVLSHLLQPLEFGLMGMAFIAINTVEALTLTGFSDAVVQRRDDPRPFLDTIFGFNVLRGLWLALGMVLVSSYVAAFFGTPEVGPVLRVISVIMVLRGVSSPAWCLRERELRLTLFYLPRLLSALADLIATCLIAYWQPSVWAMVYGSLAGALIQTAASYAVGPYRPRVRLELAKLREMRSFGKHVFRQQLLATAGEQGDRLTVGRLCDPVGLGLYSFASRLVTLPSQMILTVMMRVILPAFSRIQDEPQRIRDAFVRLIGLSALVAFPLSAGMMAVGPEMIPVLFGAKWSGMITSFQILTLLCAARTLELACGFAGGGIGRPDIAVRGSLLKLALMGALIVPATLWFGIEGTAVAVVISSVACTIYLLHALTRLVGGGFQPYLPLFGIPTLSCGLMILVVSFVRASAPPLPAPLILMVLVGAGASAYMIFVLLTDKLQGAGVTTMLLGILRAR